MQCPSCKAPVTEFAVRCPVCGKPLWINNENPDQQLVDVLPQSLIHSSETAPLNPFVAEETHPLPPDAGQPERTHPLPEGAVGDEQTHPLPPNSPLLNALPVPARFRARTRAKDGLTRQIQLTVQRSKAQERLLRLGIGTIALIIIGSITGIAVLRLHATPSSSAYSSTSAITTNPTLAVVGNLTPTPHPASPSPGAKSTMTPHPSPVATGTTVAAAPPTASDTPTATATATATPTPAPTATATPYGALPPAWTSVDIGSPGIAGSALYLPPAFQVTGGGGDIWNTSDQFHYVYQPMNGDGQIIAHVVSQQVSDSWAKAGVMIRETLTSDSKDAYMIMTPGNGANFQWRATTGSSCGWNGQTPGNVPYWVKLVRSGTTFSGYSSPDGMNWTLINSTTIVMADSVFIGLAVTAHNNGAVSTAMFDNVQIQI